MNSTFKRRMHEIVFEADTPAGKIFDVLLLLLILLSIVIVCIDSVESIHARFEYLLYFLEWTMTLLFSMEYGLRIWLTRRPTKYIFSFFGIIDLLSILPTFLSIFIAGSQSLLVFRSFRLLRVFRVLKLGRYLGESRQLIHALRASRAKIIVFVSVVLAVALIMGTLMYLVEGSKNGFTSIPRSFYWAVVTMTTVGYGDIAPQTVIGQSIATILMVLGYGIIAVPTGIVTVELRNSKDKSAVISTQACQNCSKEGHDLDAEFCKFCGEPLK
ncbi:ion transporter [Persicobacter diffluens]|uniref:Ion transporter n=1 Tax=Persicobacter diffluens TaxID=981 RepID=A0AAN4W1A5_9BACT|nr:ion transporter [Persicobacter diffluens]